MCGIMDSMNSASHSHPRDRDLALDRVRSALLERDTLVAAARRSLWLTIAEEIAAGRLDLSAAARMLGTTICYVQNALYEHGLNMNMIGDDWAYIAVGMRLLGETEWRVKPGPREGADEVLTIRFATNGTPYKQRDVQLAYRNWYGPECTIGIIPSIVPVDLGSRKFYLSDEVAEELFGPPPQSKGRVEWLLRVASLN